MSEPCEPVAVYEDGWSEWIHPAPRFRSQCCDCGLVHEMEFAIVLPQSDQDPWNDGETFDGIIIFRARREEEESES